ncbi:hypothetical protein EV121DRAFT_179676, partial [Schizophyllum commune]
GSADHSTGLTSFEAVTAAFAKLCVDQEKTYNRTGRWHCLGFYIKIGDGETDVLDNMREVYLSAVAKIFDIIDGQTKTCSHLLMLIFDVWTPLPVREALPMPMKADYLQVFGFGCDPSTGLSPGQLWGRVNEW